MKLLRIDSSARKGSVSRQMTEGFASHWLRHNVNAEVVWRDLAAFPFPSISEEWVEAATARPAQRTDLHRLALSVSDQFIDELEAADLIVIGAPMHNFTISVPLKAWIDQIVRPGRTVQYGPGGPFGLLNGKKAVVLTSRGGAYADGPARSGNDYQEPYLRSVLAFIGLTDTTFIHAENQQRLDLAAAAREAALRRICAFVDALPLLPARQQ